MCQRADRMLQDQYLSPHNIQRFSSQNVDSLFAVFLKYFTFFSVWPKNPLQNTIKQQKEPPQIGIFPSKIRRCSLCLKEHFLTFLNNLSHRSFGCSQSKYPGTMLDLITRVHLFVVGVFVCHIFHRIFSQRWPKHRKAQA